MSDWDGTSDGGGQGGSSQNQGLGPFQATVWDYIGGFDAWGLPKITMYSTVLKGGLPAVAMNIGGEWHVYQTNSVARGRQLFDRMKSLYSYTNIIGSVGK